MRGDIELNDDQKLDDFIASRNGQPTLFLFDSTGGNLHAAFNMALTIAKYQYPVGIPGGAQCSSACVLLFAAGIDRTVSSFARIGVHQAKDVTDAAQKADMEHMAQFLKIFRAPKAVIQMMLHTRGDDVSWVPMKDVAIWPDTVIVTPQQ
jgi:hypothetical protein